MNAVKQILVPVSDMDAAVDFYTTRFGFPLKFRDGDRYAALDGGSVTIALTSGEESLAGASVTFSVVTADVGSLVAAARGAGVTVASDIAQGPHETRAVLRDRDGNPVVVYSKTT
ncbi:VOC family protein [Psychromarinibacter sp. C21-152]|uniref:VOC family protein n=1 Tax=Psychromarinibacter sediminicola TaxID=3033385 RepID=A0AAE3T9F9_9RHOB|nr:VOC family protein [Psychromarinibacter sediminicola]MDF0600984.1 VOC family protein [Psychromarinibacter sediminicola]